jgi:general nucleoside transport system permease protein
MTATGRALPAMGRAIPAVAAVVVSIIVSAVIIAAAGANPATAGWRLVDGAVGDRYHIAETLVRSLPLAIVGIGAAVTLRAGLVTLGAEGQMTIGGLVAAVTVLALDGAPAVVLIPLGLVAGVAGGGLYALVPAVLRAVYRVNEILSTLLLNYLAGFLVVWLLRNRLQNPGSATPQSRPLPDAALIPNLLAGTRLHWGIVAVAVLAIALAWWVRSVRGFAYDVFGARPALGTRMGVSARQAIVATMVASGMAAGLAGWVQLAGVQHRLYTSVAGGIGFTGLLVAILGGLRPLGICAAALFFGVLATGADGLQTGTGVPASVAQVVQGIFILAVALASAARFRVFLRAPTTIAVPEPAPATPAELVEEAAR